MDENHYLTRSDIVAAATSPGATRGGLHKLLKIYAAQHRSAGIAEAQGVPTCDSCTRELEPGSRSCRHCGRRS